MADKSIDVVKILSDIGRDDLGKQLLDVLNTSKFPEITTNALLGEGTYGNTETFKNKINLSWLINPGMSKEDAAKTTVAHELTHAAENTMANRVINDKKFPEDLGNEIKKFWGFTDQDLAIRKNQQVLAKKAEDSDYRSSPDEMVAFGVGNIVGTQLGSTSIRPISHIDAIKAQEFAIQSDLFLRGIKQMLGKK